MPMHRVRNLDAPNTLLLSPSYDSTARDVCSGLAPITESSRASLIGVSLSQSPDQFLSSFRGDLPSDVTIIDVGGSTRSSTRVRNAPTFGDESRISVQTVNSPSNLTKLGVAIVNCFGELKSDGEHDEKVMCFNDLNSLLAHADSRLVGQFLQQLSTRVRDHGVKAHYHADPTALNSKEVNRLKLHVDAVVTVEETGELIVQTR